jgi:transglutaminase-like putative cysteine protease
LGAGGHERWVQRKGAQHVDPETLAIVPGSMGVVDSPAVHRRAATPIPFRVHQVSSARRRCRARACEVGSAVHRLQIDHRTEYRFSQPVTLLPHRLLLRPRESHSVRILSSELVITPAHVLRWERDAFDNSAALVTFSSPASTLAIVSKVIIEHFDDSPLDFVVDPQATFYPFTYSAEDVARLAPHRAMAWFQDYAAVEQYLREIGLMAALGQQTFVVLDTFNRAIARDFRYQAREEQGVQSPGQTLATRSGSCRDLAALFLDGCRLLGLASRFISGYHTSYANDTGPGSTHAWVEAYIPGPGWTGFDPTAGVVTGNDHIVVAVARHPEAVPPVSGSYLGDAFPKPVLAVSVRVHGV